VILSTAVCDRLLSLAPSVVFHGSRFLVPILVHDALVHSVTGQLVSLTSCPETAAQFAAAGPRPFDNGRGAIVPLDFNLLHDDASYLGLNSAGPEGEFDCVSIYPLSDYIVGVFWLDALAPGIGILPRVRPAGPVILPAHSWSEIDRRTFERREKARKRGVPDESTEPLMDVLDGFSSGVFHPNGLDYPYGDDRFHNCPGPAPGAEVEAPCYAALSTNVS